MSISHRVYGQFLCIQRFVEKSIDRSVLVFFRNRLKRPMIGGEKSGFIPARELRAFIDPASDQLHLFWRKRVLTFGWHRLIGIFPAHHFVEVAFFSFTNNKQRLARIAAFKDGSGAVEPEPAFFLLLAVALRTILF